MKTFDTLLFDVGGVMINQPNTSKQIRERLDIDNDTFENLWGPAVTQFGTNKLSENDFWQLFKDNGAANLFTSEDDVFGQTMRETLTVYTRFIEDISRLGRAGYTLAILSDTNAPHAKVLREKHVYSQFPPSNVFLSHEIGLRKPDLETYEYVLHKLGVKNPSQVLFIDDREKNLTPARQLGMQTLLAPGTEDENRAALASIINVNE